MQIGMIGLGRMGSNMVRRLLGARHDCIYYDRSMQAVSDLAGVGWHGMTSVSDFVAALSRPRAIWLMVPAGSVWLLDLTEGALNDDPALEKSVGASPTPAKDGGPCRPRSMRRCRRPC